MNILFGLFFFFFFFFFNDTATTEIYTLSLHDALPIGPDGRVYITWSSLLNIEQFDPAHPPQVIHKLRVAEPGGTRFGPPRIIDRERRPIFNHKLHANDFRVPPYAKNTVRIVAGRPRVFLIWEGCRARPLGFVCEEPAIKLRHSDDLGASWSQTTVLSAGGDN